MAMVLTATCITGTAFTLTRTLTTIAGAGFIIEFIRAGILENLPSSIFIQSHMSPGCDRDPF